jgi:hypothetical protein
MGFSCMSIVRGVQRLAGHKRVLSLYTVLRQASFSHKRIFKFESPDHRAHCTLAGSVDKLAEVCVWMPGRFAEIR